MRVLPYGPLGWLVEFGPDDGDAIGFVEAVSRADHAGVAELVPASSTVLVRLEPGTPSAAIGAWLATIEAVPVDPDGDAAHVEIRVVYDGEDLADVAAACAMSVDEVVERHSAPRYRCAFCGFAPGFGYLDGLDPRLQLPRRRTPRTRVPAGSVAIADVHSAIYPSASPGGWHLLGRTDARLWDPGRPQPALITPGTVVRFVAA